jgi:hypothetical protein
VTCRLRTRYKLILFVAWLEDLERLTVQMRMIDAVSVERVLAEWMLSVVPRDPLMLGTLRRRAAPGMLAAIHCSRAVATILET